MKKWAKEETNNGIAGERFSNIFLRPKLDDTLMILQETKQIRGESTL